MAETILMVEDEPALRETLAYNLKNGGYLVETASDGRVGIEAPHRGLSSENLVTESSPQFKPRRCCEMRMPVRSLLLLFAVVGLLLAACAPPTSRAPASPSPNVPVPGVDAPNAMYSPDAVSGDIVAAGSSTVFPLSERMKQRFEEDGFSGEITVDSIGTGAGFERFCVAGETDISNASRAIKDSEVESCKGIERNPIGFQVGIDALAIVVSSQNTFATDVTVEELAAIFSTARKWSDVRPDWPAEDILRFTPGTDSGTFDYFVEAVMAPANKNADGKADAALGEAAALNAPNLQLSEDDNVLVKGVEGSPYAVGYFGYAYYKENTGALKALSVNGVEPTEATAESGVYPISRPLFIYSDAKILQDKPQVAAFVYFYITKVADEILDVGYFPTSDQKVQENLDALKAALAE